MGALWYKWREKISGKLQNLYYERAFKPLTLA